MSNLTGDRGGHGDRDRRLLAAPCSRQPVRFQQGIEALRRGASALRRNRSGADAARAWRAGSSRTPKRAWLPSLRKGRDDWDERCSALARIVCVGRDGRLGRLRRRMPRRKVGLPGHPFRRQPLLAGERRRIPHVAALPAADESASSSIRSSGCARVAAADVVSSSNTLEPALCRTWRSTACSGRWCFPATGYLEMAAPRPRRSATVCRRSKIWSSPKPLMLPETGERRVHAVVLTPRGERDGAFQVFSRAGEVTRRSGTCTPPDRPCRSRAPRRRRPIACRCAPARRGDDVAGDAVRAVFAQRHGIRPVVPRHHASCGRAARSARAHPASRGDVVGRLRPASGAARLVLPRAARRPAGRRHGFHRRPLLPAGQHRSAARDASGRGRRVGARAACVRSTARSTESVAARHHRVRRDRRDPRDR